MSGSSTLVDYQRLGERIHLRRIGLLLSQQQAAERAGISPAFWGHIERGTRRASLETLIAICRALDVTPSELLADTLTASPSGQAIALLEQALTMLKRM